MARSPLSLVCLASPALRLAAFLLLCGSATCAVANPAVEALRQLQPQIRWAPEADYGPFVYLDSQGQPAGLSVEFLQLLGQKTGLPLHALPAAPLSENLLKARRGEVELLTSLRPTPERAEFLDFTTPYVVIPAVLAMPQSYHGPDTLNQLQGHKLAVGKGYAVEGFVRKHYPQIEWVAVPSDGLALQMLAQGKVSGMVADAASLEFLQRQSGMPTLRISGNIGFDYPLSMAWRKDLPQLGTILQNGLQQITPAERDAILQRWLPHQAELQTDQKQRHVQLAGGVLLALGVFGLLLGKRLAR